MTVKQVVGQRGFYAPSIKNHVANVVGSASVETLHHYLILRSVGPAVDLRKKTASAVTLRSFR